MNNDIRTRNFITQGSILAITGIICRIIGMLYRIPLIDVIGTQGNGYYTSAYSIYNILLILSSYSLPTAISKIISVRLAKDRFDDDRTVLRVAFLYATVIGGAMCFVMYYGSVPLAAFMEKPFCEYVLKTLAPTIWIMAYLGVLRGYFQGSGNMVPTAVSQILEQIVNAFVSIVMAIMLFDYGTKANLIYNETEYSYAYGAAGGTIGTGAGALVALLFFILMLLLYGRLPKGNGYTVRRSRGVSASRGRSRAAYAAAAYGDNVSGRSERKKESVGHIGSTLILTLLPILISSTVYNISTVLDDFIFSRMMASFGLAANVVFLWGVFGEYRILFNIPVAMANSISSSVIPSLTNAAAERNRKLVVKKIKLSIQFVMLFSLPAAAGLFALAGPVCDLLFAGNDNSVLINVLRVGCPAIVLFSLSTITNGILQGLGYLSAPLKNSFVALIVHVAALIGIITVTRDIYSVILANTIFAAIVCLLNSRCMHKHVRFRINAFRTYVVPLIASVIMGAAVYGISMLLGRILPESIAAGRIGLGIIVGICILIGVPAYFALLIQMRAFTKDELIEMPMGLRLYRFVHRLGLM